MFISSVVELTDFDLKKQDKLEQVKFYLQVSICKQCDIGGKVEGRIGSTES